MLRAMLLRPSLNISSFCQSQAISTSISDRKKYYDFIPKMKQNNSFRSYFSSFFHLSFLPYSSKYSISVYEGISTSLLATMSLSQNIKGDTHQQLIKSLRQKGSARIIQSDQLYQTMLEIDRGWFVEVSKQKENNVRKLHMPQPISCKQNMTDIFTHAVILNTLQPYLSRLIYESLLKAKTPVQNTIRILDVGTGHGYLAFVLEKFIRKKINRFLRSNPICQTDFKIQGCPQIKYQILAIDFYEKCIKKCEQLRQNLLSNYSEQGRNQSSCIEFKQMSVNQLLKPSDQEVQIQRFDKSQMNPFNIIIGGFFMEQKLSSKIQAQLLKTGGIGIWPALSDSGQAIYKFIKKYENKDQLNQQNIQLQNVKKQYIMETLFSQQIVSTSVDKFFLQADDLKTDKTQEQFINRNSFDEGKSQSQIAQQNYQRQKQQRSLKKKKLQEKLKVLIEQQNLRRKRNVTESKLDNTVKKPITLAQLKKVPEIDAVLTQLSKYK